MFGRVRSWLAGMGGLQRALIVLGVVAAIAVVVGFTIDPSDFLGNFLAEVVGFAAGAIVTYVVIERVIAGERRARFRPVRQATIRVLRRHLTEIALQYPLVYPAIYRLVGTSTEGFTEHADGQVEYMGRVIAEARTAGESKDWQRWDKTGARGPDDFAIELHDKLRTEIDGILDRAYPRVLEIGDMPHLASALAALEDAYSEWRNQIIIHKEVVAGAPYRESLSFLERVRDVYVSLHHEEQG